MRNLVCSFVLLGFSVVTSLAAGEGLARLLVNPVNYLEPYLFKDEVLGHKIEPNSSGHDSWGFRNKTVPKSAKIITIGDSQTYGVSAAAKHSWPATLQELRDESVYNLSLGGYGPAQYYYLLNSKALVLEPRLVIVGFYFGNDFLMRTTSFMKMIAGVI
jgi:hypothetical protein